MVGLEDGDVLPVGRLHDGRPAVGRIGHVGVPAQDGIDVAGQMGGQLGGIGMGEYDDDVGGPGVLECGGFGVGGGGGRCEGQRVRRRRGEERGQLVGHDADEADLDSVDLLD